MSSLFVSHSSHDNVEVGRLYEWLLAKGYVSLFLDLDPQRGIPSGAKWESELYSQLRRADAVLFVASPASVASQWCFAELAMARSLGKTIIPVTLTGDAGHPLLGDTQAVDLSGADERAFERLDRALRSADLDPERTFAWDARRSPFPGLGSFEERDAGVFFGRQPEIEQLLELLRSSRRRYAGRLVAVVGPSGSGKSSLVRAGLIPRLRRVRRPWLVLPALRPAGQPVRQLALVLADAFRASSEPRSVDEIERTLDAGAGGLVALAEELGHLGGDPPPAVLVFVDQAEELVTLAGAYERERFLALLHEGTRADGPLWALLTLRSEFLSAFLQSEGGARLFDEQLLVGPLDRSRLAEVIERPVERAGLDLAPGLVGRMVQDTGGGDALPLLAYTLGELYERTWRRPRGMITSEAYEDLGGVVGALRRSADREQRRLRDRGLGERVIPALRRLVAIGPEGQPTRRRLPRAALGEQDNEVIDAFIEARLLTSGQIDGESVVEVAHEALLRQWPPLNEAIEVHHQELRLRSELERAAQDWERNDRRGDYLLTGERLYHAQRMTAPPHAALGDLADLERDFLTASLKRHEHEQAAKRRRTRRAFAGLLTALAVVSALALVALLQAKRATDQRDTARATLLATNALAELPNDPGQALALAMRAFTTRQTDLSEGVLRLAASEATPQLILRGHTARILSVTFAADGRHLASAGEDGLVRVWDLRAPRTRPTVLRHGDWVFRVAFAPDGRHLATAGVDGKVRVWDWHAPRTPRAILRDNGGLVTFAPDGRHLATAGVDGKVRVWDWHAPRTPRAILRGRRADYVSDVAFAPDGRHLVIAGVDGRVRVWDWPAPRTRPSILPGRRYSRNSVAFAVDGRHLASAGDDGKVRVWDWHAPRTPPTILPGNAGREFTMVFAADGRHLAGAGSHGTVRVWDLDAPRTPPTILRGHSDSVNDVAFAPDGRHLASASDDGTVRVWDWHTPRTPATILSGHRGAVSSAAFAADGRHLAIAGSDGKVRVWDWHAPRTPRAILRHGGQVYDVAFAADGRHLAGVNSDGTARVWNWHAPRKEPTTLRDQGELVQSTWSVVSAGVAFAPDGRHLASVGDDEAVRVWDWHAPRTPPTILPGNAGRVFTMAFAPDGHHVVSAGADGKVRMWDWHAPRTLPTILRGAGDVSDGLVGNRGAVNDVAFAPDGRHLATAVADGTVRVWDWHVPRAPATVLGGNRGAVSSVAFTADRHHLIGAGSDGTARIWDCQRCGDIDQVLKLARSRAPREIDARESRPTR